MKLFLLISAFTFITATAYSQDSVKTVKFYSQYDSLYTKIPLKLVGYDRHIYNFDSLTYFNNADSLAAFFNRINNNPYQKSVPEPDFSKIDFSKEALILYAYHGVDCHSKFDIAMYDDTDTREYKLLVKVIYGGCRAGGYYYINWAVIPKPPADYKVTYYTYLQDRRYDDN